MQSKTLFCEYFNRTLFRKNLTRFWPLWAMPSFIGALFPLALLTQLLRYEEQFFGNNEMLEFTGVYYSVVAYGVPIISLCYAVLVAIAVWSYLFNSRSVGMMHTLPLRREGLFLTSFLSGMAMMLIPYAVTGALCIIISLCFGFFEPVGLLVTILCVIGDSLFYFGSATLVAFITGNLFAMPVLYFIFHFLAVGLDALVNLFADGFLFGVRGSYSGVVEFLSPTVYLMNHVGVDYEYVEEFVPDMLHGHTTEHGVGYINSKLVDVTLENGWLIAVYALAGVVLLGIAYALYRVRRSESAGDVVAVGWMKPIFRYGVAICGSLAGGMILYAVFWSSFQNGNYYDPIPFIIAMLIAGAIFYYAASMLLAKSLRVFRGSWKGLAITALSAIVICCSLYFDVFHVETRVPAVDRIEHMTFHVADNNYNLYPEEDAELIEEIRKVHTAIAADAEYIIDMEENWRFAEAKEQEDISMYNYVRISYYLKNGTSVQRRYEVPMMRSRMEDSTTYDYALSQLVNSQAAKNKRFHLKDSYVAESGNIYLENTNSSTSFGNREAAKLMESIAMDVANGTCGTYTWFDDTPYGSHAMDYAMDLNIDFQKPVQKNDGTVVYEYDSINIRVRPEMTNTVTALLELNLATKDDLKTRLELYPESYAPEMYEKYVYDAPTSFPAASEIMIGSSEAASIGIIGGADGPTEVFVASTVS